MKVPVFFSFVLDVEERVKVFWGLPPDPPHQRVPEVTTFVQIFVYNNL